MKRLVWLSSRGRRHRSPSLCAHCSANDAKATAFSGQCECFAPFEPLSLITPEASRDSRRYRKVYPLSGGPLGQGEGGSVPGGFARAFRVPPDSGRESLSSVAATGLL